MRHVKFEEPLYTELSLLQVRLSSTGAPSIIDLHYLSRELLAEAVRFGAAERKLGLAQFLQWRSTSESVIFGLLQCKVAKF